MTAKFFKDRWSPNAAPYSNTKAATYSNDDIVQTYLLYYKLTISVGRTPVPNASKSAHGKCKSHLKNKIEIRLNMHASHLLFRVVIV